jgi:hypothetical protein
MADTTIVNGQTVKTDNCICLYETVGYAPDLNFDNENVEYPGLQIICRGISYAETRGRIDEVYKKLHGNGEISNIGLITAEQSPAGLGKDNQNRWEFSVNFKITKSM